MTSSLLISTYNWPKALHLCLQSVAGQTMLPQEVIVCDDGSGEETKGVVAHFAKNFPVPLIHIWQPDEGFKLSQIRNKGIAAAKGDYIIQVDGDLLLHRHFVKDHLGFARIHTFSTGSRVLLSAGTTTKLLTANTIALAHLQKEKNLLNGLHLPMLHNILGHRYKQHGKHQYYVKGCNMAFWKKDLVAINGYNEDFTGWGKEDSEIAIRLINAGIKKRFLKFGGIAYHLYHKEVCRALEERNVKLMDAAITNKTMIAANGLSKYL